MFPEVVANYRCLLSRLVGRTIKVSIPTSVCKPIRISRETIERILLNLVKNAAVATPQDGVIHIEADYRDEERCQYFVITVADEGIGMCQSTVEMLQAGVLPPRATGKGLGFRIVQELVADSGGFIEISSKLGEGTRISVKWPEVGKKANLRCFQLSKVNFSK
ncbi:MAG TPA: ATP-binding protein [Edaphobacter sp.]|jgi:signal transduction histidine kinase